MTQEQKEYIEQNISRIENGEWDYLFKHAPHKGTTEGFGSLLYDAGIDCLQDLEIGPFGGFENSTLTSFNYPHIKHIKMLCFRESKMLTSVTLSKNCTEVETGGFAQCSNLHIINIENPSIILGNDAFSACGDVIINYSGTKREWKIIYNSRAFTSTYFTVNCLDGTLDKKKS